MRDFDEACLSIHLAVGTNGPGDFRHSDASRLRLEWLSIQVQAKFQLMLQKQLLTEITVQVTIPLSIIIPRTSPIN